MGAEEFFQIASGKNAKKAFTAASKTAAYEYGHRGYTGSLAEKESFVMVSDKVFDSYKEAYDFADQLIENGDEKINDKWGPAGCVQFKDKDSGVKYLFFGLAAA